MVVHRRKKNVKQRGSKRCGWGIKKHRGAGSRGGRGMAGSGKRADQKKQSIIKQYGMDYFGNKGFFSIKKRIPKKAISLSTLDKNVHTLAKKGIVKEEKGIYHFDAQEQGYNKVLANGKINHKFIIRAESFSKKAIEIIEAAGGKAISEKENVSD